MKILIVPEFYAPVLGGVAQHATSLTESLVKRGHKVKVITLGWKDFSQHNMDNGFEFIRTSGLFQNIDFLYGNKNYRFHPPMPDPIFSKKINKLVESFRPDLIHCHGWTVYSALKVKSRFNTPIILTLHDYGLMCPARTMYNSENNVCTDALTPQCKYCANKKVGKSKALAMCWALRKYMNDIQDIDRFIAVSTSVKEIYSRWLDSNKINVICNFYGSSDIPNQKNGTFLPDDFILFAGALKPEKGVDVLVKAYQKLNTNTKLVIIGMRRQGFNFDSNSVILLENQPRHVVMEAWQKCRFGIVPSIWADPCHTVALEAMSCGKAVIGSDIGGLQDIILNNETGILVPPGDVDELSMAIEKLLSSPVLANDMGQKGKKRLVKQFALDKIITDIEKLYYEMVSSV